MNNKLKKMLDTLPGFYKAEASTFLRGILEAWAVGDEQVEANIIEGKKQLFVKEGEGKYLDRLGSNVGVSRSAELGIGDDDFRELIPVMSTYPKQVRSTLIALFDVFWGPGFTRANLNSGNVEPFNFGTGITITGTATFYKDQNLVKGQGTSFLTDLQLGQFIKPIGLDDTHYVRISRIISNTEVQLSTPWKFDTIGVSQVNKFDYITLNYIADRNEEKTIRIAPNAMKDISEAYAKELVTFINTHPEHSDYITGSVFLDPLAGNKLNIRTKTAGLRGSIQITGGSANVPSMLNFSLDKQTEVRAAVYEVNPNEIVVEIPSSVPVLRRTLKGSLHPKLTKAEITSISEPYNFSVLGASSNLTVEVDGVPYNVVFNNGEFNNASRVSAVEVNEIINKQLNFLQSFTKTPTTMDRVGLKTTEGSVEYQVIGGTANSVLKFPTTLQQDPDFIKENYPSAYVFDPTGQLYTVTRINARLIQEIGEGSIQPTISVDDASEFPNKPGLVLFNFGRANQEGPILYNSRPNNSTLLVDASHIFQKQHDVGRYVNLISDRPTIPRVTGDDYPVFVVGTSDARKSAQQLVEQLKAAGVVIRFIISFPEVLFQCTINPSDDPDFIGARSDIDDLLYEC